ncbi:Peroxisomal leader peptide-processing protease [Irineochytrium annulatum]|nr:Peroxisomal leader peptide-processing protease [Irineochytrium annulatum]
MGVLVPETDADADRERIAIAPVQLFIRGPDPQGLIYAESCCRFSALPDYRKGLTTIGCSGVALAPADGGSKALIVTHAAPFEPFLRPTMEENAITSGTFALKYAASVTLAFDAKEGVRVQAATPTRRLTLKKVSMAFRTLVNKDPSGWRFGFGPDRGAKSGLTWDSMGELLVFETDWFTATPTYTFNPGSGLNIGDNTDVIGSPFGVHSPHMFMNSRSHGIISNMIAGVGDPPVVITDARCLPGMEGGLVIFKKDSNPSFGILTPPMRRAAEMIVDMNFIIPLFHLWDLLPITLPNPLTISRSPAPAKPVRFLGACSLTTVLITFRTTWASGVLISARGHVVTNAHVLAPFVTKRVDGRWILKEPLRVRISTETTTTTKLHRVVDVSDILFISGTFWDLALIRLPMLDEAYRFMPFDAKQSRLAARDGCGVYAIGYSGFDPIDARVLRSKLGTEPTTIRASGLGGPSVSRGVLGKSVVYPANGSLVRYQTSAMIQNGARYEEFIVTIMLIRGYGSGGLLVDSAGTFLGILASNLNLNGIDQKVAHLSYAIPAVAFMHAFLGYIDTGREGLLDRFKYEADGSVADLWSPEVRAITTKENWGRHFKMEAKL